jgi:sulfur relay (sulfurtransferase) complex TusBCD TusD component (DsrE family)
MKLGIVVYSNDPETVWNAFRFGNFALVIGDEVRIFLIGKGVECTQYESLDREKFKVSEQVPTFIVHGGKIFVCGTCLEIHRLKAPETFITSALGDMHEIIRESDKIVTF